MEVCKTRDLTEGFVSINTDRTGMGGGTLSLWKETRPRV